MFSLRKDIAESEYTMSTLNVLDSLTEEQACIVDRVINHERDLARREGRATLLQLIKRLILVTVAIPTGALCYFPFSAALHELVAELNAMDAITTTMLLFACIGASVDAAAMCFFITAGGACAYWALSHFVGVGNNE